MAPETEMHGKATRLADHVDAQLRYCSCNRHNGLADQVLLERDGDGWKCVGYYVDDTIVVFRRVQNTGLADVLFLRCMEHRGHQSQGPPLRHNGVGDAFARESDSIPKISICAHAANKVTTKLERHHSLSWPRICFCSMHPASKSAC